MKQLPRISETLFCQPWCIIPSAHSELVTSYRNYLTGNLPELLAGSGTVSGGMTYEVSEDGRLALLTLDGVVVKRAPDMLCGPSMIDLAALDLLLQDIARDNRVETLVLALDTPGGCGIGLAETSANLADVRDSGTRIVAYTDYLCASAGYWIASEADEIHAAPSAQVGSIGTYIAALDDSEAWKMEGVKLKLFKDGDLKAMGHPGKEWTPEEEAHLQERLTSFAAGFKNQVRGRRPGLEESSMQGQCFTASEAPYGLIDGTARDLTALLKSELERLDA
jgi:ClpP class serine protease